MKKYLIIFLALIISNIAICNENTFTIYPQNPGTENKNWIKKSVNPGKEINEKLILENSSNEAISLKLEVREFTAEKEFKIIESETYKNIGNWIKLNETRVSLEPGEKKVVKASISPPENTETKEYHAVILASEEKNDNGTINIVTRIGVRIYLNVTNAKIEEKNILQLSTTQIIIISISSVCLIIGLLINTKKWN